jgi:plasmid stabilization system protein ParE
MAYRVSLTAFAEADAAKAFERIRDAAPQQAEAWLERLFAAMATLEHLPSRCPIIAEAEELGQPLRQLIFGRGAGVYRIIFHIKDDDGEVRVLRIWHGSRDALGPFDFGP